MLLVLDQMGLLRVGSPGSALTSLQGVLPRVVALVVGITVHEFSHGFVATLFGDDVPRRAGRLTLNPLKHLDPLGTLLILVGPIGWGRPMPINPAGMRHPNLGWALSSVAGPASNLLLATLLILAIDWGGAAIDRTVTPYVVWLLRINIGLAIFNLLPLPPLDGFGFVYGLSPTPVKLALAPIATHGLWILLAFLFLPGVIPGFPPLIQEWVSAGSSLFLGFFNIGV